MRKIVSLELHPPNPEAYNHYQVGRNSVHQIERFSDHFRISCKEPEGEIYFHAEISTSIPFIIYFEKLST